MESEWEHIKYTDELCIGDYVRSEGFSCSQKYIFRIDCLEELIENEKNIDVKKELEKDLKFLKDDYENDFGIREGVIIDLGDRKKYRNVKIRNNNGDIIDLISRLGDSGDRDSYCGRYWHEVYRKK